jgi:pimeloyl-ACP methyl ester carboxylesterase
MTAAVTGEGYAPVNGVEMYWRSLGEGGTPLVVVHGGFGLADMFGDVLDRLAERRRVIAVELQGHGRTRDIDRPFRYEFFGDDLAALIAHLGLERADRSAARWARAPVCAPRSSIPTGCGG